MKVIKLDKDIVINRTLSDFMGWKLTNFTQSMDKLTDVWNKLGFNYEAGEDGLATYNFVSICKDKEDKFSVGFNYVVEGTIIKNILDKGDTLSEAAAKATRKVVDLELLGESDEDLNA